MKVGFSKLLPVMAAVSLSWGLMANSAQAGRIVLTGHDSDFHQSTAARTAVTGMFSFLAGDPSAPSSALPVLVFDHGTQASSLLTSLGIANTRVDPNLGVPAASLFNTSTFRAIVVASDFRCGGCDNDDTSSTNLAAAKTSFASFFNAGGGIIAFAGATNANYYAFVPETAASFGSPPSSGFYQTAEGAAVGITAQNGDATHNFFREPGTFGTSALWQVAERNTLGTASTADDPAETIFLGAGTIVCTVDCVIVGPGPGGTGSIPEPATLALAGLALAGLATARRKQRKLSS
jgi:hypothetical protein